MTNYIKTFVEGFGINFQNLKTNHDAAIRANEKWAEISQSLKISKKSIIFSCGAKNNGKSSLVRYLINKYIAKNNVPAYYIDFDPGQPEMTTAGIISAHLIKPDRSRLQSPTFLNVSQHSLIAASSVGGTNMSVNPRLYINNCRYVFSQVKQHIAENNHECPIFINTMGFVRSVGLAMLMDLIKVCTPTNLLVLNIENDPMRTIYADLSSNVINNTRASFFYGSEDKNLQYQYDIHNLQFSYVDSTSIANKNRVALQLAYLALIPEALYKPIMKLEPKWIPLKSVAIYCVSSYPLKPVIVLELLVHSWVHLVKLKKWPVTPNSVNQNMSLDTQKSNETNENQQSPEGLDICNIIDEVGENNVLGCGIIKEIDFEKNLLAIITPLDQDSLDKEMDCIIKPLSIQVSREILQPGLI